jgi:Kef-type K+ transport system membrane component KefB
MDMPETPLRRALRRLTLGAFACTTAVIVLLLVVAVFSATGLSSDPHGYGVFAGVLLAAILTPVALALWLLYRSLRRRGD